MVGPLYELDSTAQTFDKSPEPPAGCTASENQAGGGALGYDGPNSAQKFYHPTLIGAEPEIGSEQNMGVPRCALFGRLPKLILTTIAEIHVRKRRIAPWLLQRAFE